MNTWTEANFLERLQAPLKSAHEASAGSCPDAEMMTAYVENTASEFVRNAVDEHLKTCGNCRELAERIAGFDVASAEGEPSGLNPMAQVEWQNAEKRLNIEAENFVRTAEVDFKRAARIAGAEHADKAAAWRFPWEKTAWSVAAVVALVVTGFLLMRKEGGTATPVSTAVSAPPATVAPAAAAPAAPVPPPPIAVANGYGPAALPSSVTNELLPESALPSVQIRAAKSAKNSGVKHAAPATNSAAVVVANAASGTGADVPAGSATANSAAAANAPAPNDTTATNQNEVASNAGAPAPPGSSTSSAGNAVSSTATGAAPTRATFAHAGTAAHSAPKASAIPPQPVAIQLSAGTRVWIVFKSVKHESDAKFAFMGTLLEPVSGAGATPLAKGTEIDGTGAVVNGKTSLYIEEIVVRGAEYRLKGANGAVRPANAGGGAAVAFDAGQVQEMWLAAPAEYEKTGDTAPNGASSQ
jgi:hypothetical protein